MRPVDRDVAMRELDTALAQLSRGSTATCLSSLVGVPILEALRAPIFQAVVEAARRGPTTPAQTRTRGLAFKLGDWARGELSRHKGAPSLRPGSRATSIIVLPRMPTDIRQLAPLVRELRGRGIAVTSVAHDHASRRVSTQGGLAAALGPQVVGARFRALIAELHASRLSWGTAGSVAGLAGEEVVALTRHQVFAHLWDVASVAAQTRALCASKPSWVVVGNDLSLHGRTAALVANAQGARTAVLVHGLAAANPMLGYHIVDRIFAWGDEQRSGLIRYGVHDSRISVCGAPALDDPTPPLPALPAEIAAALGMTEGCNYVLLALSGPGQRISVDEHESLIDLAAGAAQRLGQPVLVKLHSKDSEGFYVGHGFRVIPRDLAARVEVSHWVAASSCVWTSGSAIALDAMLLGIPVVHMALSRELRQVDYAVQGAAYLASTVDDLVAQTVRSPNDAHALSVAVYLRSKFGVRDGKASKRVADVLLA